MEKEVRTYVCDEGHRWSLIRELEEPERPAETRCPFGHEAVTLARQPFVNQVEIRINSALRVADSVTGQRVGSHRYFVSVMDLRTGAIRACQRELDWENVTRAVHQLRELSAERAWALLDEFEKA